MPRSLTSQPGSTQKESSVLRVCDMVVIMSLLLKRKPQIRLVSTFEEQRQAEFVVSISRVERAAPFESTVGYARMAVTEEHVDTRRARAMQGQQ